MSNLTRKDFSCLVSIIDSVEKIVKYSLEFKNPDELYNDSKSFDAVMMNFVVIGEMASKLSDELRLNTGETINWTKIIGLRNIVAHNYFGIDAEEIWQIMHGSLKQLHAELENIV